jgi:D-alanyl-lipoteichoic acid acyltransferase DltB (MBOAT superfamily)
MMGHLTLDKEKSKMVFSNSAFLFLFLPITLIVYYFPLVRNHINFRNIWLLFVSLGFYAWGEPLYVFLMVLSITVNFFLGKSVEKHRKSEAGGVIGKRIIILACIYNLGMLFIFKYLSWVSSLIFGTSFAESHFSSLTLPLGISFYTFQALSYVIDIYRGKADAQKNILNTGLYIAFFPQLIAGPIVRYDSIAKQLLEREHTKEKFADGVWRFTIGLSKKLLLANQLAVIVDVAFARDASERSVVLAWAGALCFMLQIYFDFSGYSDMAIGLGKMFGFEFSENFNYPYISKSITEYWRRWHISLGEWFRDYLFYPVSMGPAVKLRQKMKDKVSRKTSAIIASVFSLFIVWMATGIWHGANMTFVVWGLIQFVFIVWEQYRKPMKNKRAGAVLGFVSTFFVIMISKVIFNASSLTQAFHYYGSMLHLQGNAWSDEYGLYWLSQYMVFIVLGLVFAFPVVESVTKKINKTENNRLITLNSVVQMLVMIGFLTLDILYAVVGGYNPFIYFNF